MAEAFVGRLANGRVAEPEGVPVLGLNGEQSLVHEVLEPGRQRGFRLVASTHRRVEFLDHDGPAERARPDQRPQVLVGQAVEPGLQEWGEPGREQGIVAEIDHRLDHQRVAGGTFDDASEPCIVDLPIRARSHRGRDLASLVVVEFAEVDHDVVFARRERRADRRQTLGHHDRDRRIAGTVRQEVEQSRGRAVRPVPILELDHQWAFARRGLDRAGGQFLGHLVTHLAADGRRPRRLLEPASDEGAEERREVAGAGQQRRHARHHVLVGVQDRPHHRLPP